MKPKFTVFIVFLFIFASSAFAQGIANDIKLDTMKKYLKELTGTSYYNLNGNTYRITTRTTTHNDIVTAENYLKFRLRSYGLNVIEQPFTYGGANTNARNILAVQIGSQFPDQKYIICAHFDAVSGSPGANDNGSGTVTVLEAARIISKLNPKYTILYALWSGEEQGLQGSNYYAAQAFTNSEKIKGVINIDMIGDGNNFNDLMLYSVTSLTSPLIDNLVAINTSYGINTSIIKNYTMEGGSDHYPFYLKGYPAYLLIEKDPRGDPTYHNSTDTYANINFTFFEKCAKLAILSLAELSGAVNNPNPVEEFTSLPTELILHQNYPNPFNPSTVISYDLKEGSNVRLQVYDALGREVKTLVNEYKPAGNHRVLFSVESSSATSGVYFYKLQTGASMMMKKMVYLK